MGQPRRLGKIERGEVPLPCASHSADGGGELLEVRAVDRDVRAVVAGLPELAVTVARDPHLGREQRELQRHDEDMERVSLLGPDLAATNEYVRSGSDLAPRDLGASRSRCDISSGAREPGSKRARPGC